MGAWLLTGSVAILTDALESTVNVIAGAIGLYSVTLSAKPRDSEHPYGHGKVEFITSAIEGILISLAGLLIIWEAAQNLRHPHALRQLDYGIWLIASTALVNYAVGHYCVKKGKLLQSPVLIGSGMHLKTDTYSTLGLLLGLLLLIWTGYTWIDSVAAMVFALFILYTGYGIIRRAVSGMMDERDDEIIDEIVQLLNEKRDERWIDVHNMRVINYAGFYHIDCHLTVPFYINVNEAHRILDSLTEVFSAHFRQRVEFFIHVDGCIPEFQCGLCNRPDCAERKTAFTGHLAWTHNNILSNHKHGSVNPASGMN